ncbi:MAG: FG-GAP repeat protein [Thermoanaerobaculia bacterium]
MIRIPLPETLLLSTLLAAAPASAELAATATTFWTEDTPGLASGSQTGAHFGAAVAAGDFDCDGYDDLAIGVPDDDDVALADVGFVVVLPGSPDGPTGTGFQIWEQSDLQAAEEAADDHFGEVLASGDFNGDGCADLAIGMPREDIGSETDAGGLQILYGGEGGLAVAGNTFFRQGSGGITAAPEAFDEFGAALAVGDFDDDGQDDLAIGAPGEDIEAEDVAGAGAVHVLFGAAGVGLTGDGDLVLFRGNGLPGSPEANEGVGSALAAGEFNPLFAGDDLAIGAPRGAAGAAADAGRVLLLSDLTGGAFVAEYAQGLAGVPGAPEDFDQFGAALAAGDFDGDGIAELVVGAPGEDLEDLAVTNAGAVEVLDFDGDGDLVFTQEDFGPEHADAVDELGRVLAAGDFDGDGVDDLAVGVPLEDLGPIPTGGLVHVLAGVAGAGLTTAGRQLWLQTIDPSEDGDRFGAALAAGRFSGHAGADLAIGVPGESLPGHGEAGGVNLLFSADLFHDGFESGDLSRWARPPV